MPDSQSVVSRPLRYTGRRRDGTGITGVGRNGESAADIAERLFSAGFRTATVWHPDGHQEVGGVRKALAPPHERVWWGESSFLEHSEGGHRD
jgi:hypothetical protein